MNKRYIPLLIAMLFLGLYTGIAFGQQRQEVKSVTIESVVKDDSGTPIPNAIISGKEGAVEVMSDANGQFSIEVPENTDLLIEAKGFNSMVVPSALASQGVTLIKAPFLMDDASMVNIPFAKIKKGEVANSISVLNPKEIVEYDNTQSIYDFLRGRVPGMLGNTNIRGIGNAVFIIDGVPRDPTYINLEEVEQITVLKDVNAAMLYGSQARNGVIMITTKRGEAFKRRLNFTVEQGMSKPIALPKYLNSADYMTLYNEALANDGLDPIYADTTIAKYKSGTNPYRYPDIDYYSSEYLRSSLPTTKILTEFSGGNAITQYYTNASWIHSGSLYEIGEGKKATNDRFNIRANVNLKINDFMDGYIDAVGIFTQAKGPLGDFWGTAATAHPNDYSNLLPIDRIKANATFSGGADLAVAKLVDGKYILGGSNQYQDNVYGNMLLAGYDQTLERTATFNNGVNVDLRNIVEGLKFRTYLSFDIYNIYHQQVINTYAVYDPVWQTNVGGVDSISQITQINKDVKTGVQRLPFEDANGVPLMSYQRRIGAYAMFDYARTFSDVHNITGTLLAYSDILRVNDILEDEKHAHLGLRITYDYQKKYFIDFSSAYVNGFRLQKGNRGAFSPSIGLGYVITEDLMSGSSIVNYLKLKLSAGIMNTEFGGTDYKLYERTYVYGSNFGWDEGLRSNRAVFSMRSDNPDLTFEKMKNINVGFEGYFFNSSLYAVANFFSTKNTGQLVQRTTYPALLYLNVPYENYNETSYTGAELGLILSKTMGDFSFDLGTNFLYATSKAKVRDEIWDNDYQYRQGLPNDAMFGLEAIGFFRDANDITNSPLQLFGTVKPGDIKYQDQNDDGVIDQNDQIEIGNSQARFSYGLSLNLKYKYFTLFAIGNGRTGSDAYYSGAYFRVTGNDKYSEEVLDRWTPATASSASYPRLSSSNNTNNTQNSTFWLYSNNFFTLDRVQLTFDLPRNIANKLVSKEVAVYLRGENLARFSEDAEKRQLVIGGPPLYRNYAIGVKFMF